MNSNVIKTMSEIKLSKNAKNASLDNPPKEIKKDSFGEISDEDIEKEIKKRYETTHNDAGFRDGCAWYREQLKLRQ